jgi:large subunit ribosomal protein L25
MSAHFELTAEPRAGTGKSEARRLRHANKVPAVIYGAKLPNESIVLDHDEIKHSLEIEAFTSAIIDLKSNGATQQVILRDVQMHPYKAKVTHVDFQRVSATEKLHTTVPLHFVGEDDAPGVEIDGGIVSHMISSIDVTCFPKDLPGYIEVDVSQMKINDSLHLSDLVMPEGVEITSLAHGGEDHAVVSILHAKVVVEEEPEEGEEEELETLAEGEEEEEREESEDEDER